MWFIQFPAVAAEIESIGFKFADDPLETLVYQAGVTYGVA